MRRDEVLGVYGDTAFAEEYDERFLLAPWPKHGADIEVEMLRELLDGEDPRWVDLCCGTGYFLGQFPDVERAGLDISPAMLARARLANPDIELREADVCVDVPDWHGRWSVVSCMWMAYCYLQSMAEIEQLIANMVAYTREGGSVFLPSVIDLEDLRPHTMIDYEQYPDVWGGRIALTGYYWTWEEPNGNVNENMMAPHVGHFVRLLEPHFERVEVVRYPLFMPGFVSRKAVVATGRRPAGQTGTAEVVWQEIPKHPDDIAAEERARAEEEQRVAEAEQRVAEEAERAAQEELRRAEEIAALTAEAERLRAAADAARADAEAARAVAEDHERAAHAAHAELGEAIIASNHAQAHWEAERANLCAVADAATERAVAAEEGQVLALRSSEHVPTGQLVRELASRANPSDGRLWVAARRRAAKVVKRG